MMKLIPIYLRAIGIVFISLFFVPNAYPQEEENIRELFVEAESYFLYEEFADALPLYQRILKTDPENFNINYKIGRCYLNDPYQVSRSIAYLEKAVKGTSPDYRINNYREKMAPMEAYLYLGDAYRVNNRLDDAIETYQLFKEVLDPQVYIDGIIELVDAQIEACQVAKAQFSHPKYFTSVNLGATINERYDEINPVISGDGSVLVFTRKLPFYDAVFYSTKLEDGSWSYPINLTPSFAVDGNTYVTGISYYGDEIFVYRSDNFDGNIYVSKRQDDQWSKLEKLNGNINTKYWESHASISDDGKTLYFTSNRRGGYGGLDIYKSERKDGGDWGPAINLGPVINTPYNEETPFVTDYGKTLYFSSMGHYNMGGYDIFYSTKLDNGQWSIPLNVGYPLNTTNDDLFLVPTPDGSHAYYAKYDPEDSYGLSDIYSMEVYTDLHPRKFILNGITRTRGNVQTDLSQYHVSLIDTKTGNTIDQAELNEDGTYSLDAISGDLEIRITGQDLTLSSEKINIPADNPSDIISHISIIEPGVKKEVPLSEAAAGTAENLPRITANITSYNVTSDQSIPIELELDTNTKLHVETQVNGQPFKTEDFDIDRSRFLYMMKPFQGDNLLRFTLTNEKGLSNTLEVRVNYTPEAEELAGLPAEEGVASEEEASATTVDWYTSLAALAEGNLKAYLQSPALQEMRFGTLGELYDFLIAHGLEGGFTIEEVDELMARYLAQKNLDFFADELNEQSTDSISVAMERLLTDTAGIFMPETLLDHLFLLTEQGYYSTDELRDALYRVATRDRDALTVIDLLQSYSTGNLAAFLESLMLNPSEISESDMDDAGLFIQNAETGAYTLQELDSAIMKASYEMDVDFLYLSLLSISKDSLRNTLVDLNMWEEQIRNAHELVTYLFDRAENDGYNQSEVIDLIEEIRGDPYGFIEGFRDMLANAATGTLKVFLQQIDIRGLHIDTYEKLINYLLSQSQYHEFNREMIYQLLIDIIDVANTREFIDLLLQFADDRISSALYATDLEQYSTPLEVVKYLLSASDQYAYTEKDLIQLLTKILLERKPLISEAETAGGWLSELEKSELISALIIVNGIIIVLVIIFVFRRKQRKETDQPPD